MNVIGTRIKKLREESGLSQKELAEKLNIANSTLSQYETGQRVPSDDIKIKIADTFQTTIDYLLGRTDKPNQENKIHTVAAHHEGEEYTEEEKEDIENFIKNFVLNKRKK